MKNSLLIVTLMATSLAFAQDKWPNLMFDRDANFYDIKQDFKKHYQAKAGNSLKSPKGTGIKQFQRWEYYWEHRVDENGNFPREGHVLNEISRYNNLLSANRSR